MGAKTKTRTRRRITPMQLEMAANVHLDGMVLADVLGSLKVETDKDGYYPPHIMKGIKTSLAVAERMAPEDTVKRKIAKMSAFLADYV